MEPIQSSYVVSHLTLSTSLYLKYNVNICFFIQITTTASIFYRCRVRLKLVVVEVVVTVGVFVTAVMWLIGCHYVFNLVYPENLSCFYIFFQKFILKIMDNSKLPPRVSGLINKIKKLE